MSNKKFMVKCITALMLCLISLASCRDKIPTNEIHYTTIDNSVLPIKDLFYFGAGRIVSNSYDPDKNVCILKLDKDVTEIGKETFCDCSSLTSITIPPTVTEIGEGAFYDCSSLTSITFPELMTEIGGWAFCGCSSLTSITIPPLVTKIGNATFLNCFSLTYITIPPSVTEIGAFAFLNCYSLTEVRIPKGCYVTESAFKDCPNVQIIRY